MLVMVGGPATAREVVELVESAREVCRRLEPVAVGLHETPEVFDALVALERLAGGAVLRMADRYEEAGAWKRNGARSPEDDISRKTGTSTSQARRKLSTSKRLERQSRTDTAVRNGEVSPEQANEVSTGAEASPEEEDGLLDSARQDPLHELRKKSAAAKAKADEDREATRRRLHNKRCLRRWNDAEGMGNLMLRLPADEMAEVDAALKRPIDRRLADARHAGRFEPVEAYAADVAAERLIGGTDDDGDGTVPSKPNQAVRPDKKVIARIDLEALNRGRVEGEETCEIAGVGPVAVSVVRSMLSEAFLALVITDGVDVLNVTHLGRQVTATQRTALEARGCSCEREGCASTHLLDIDHNEGWALTHDTRIEDLSWFCWHCHGLKTRHDLRATGPPGARRFITRDGTPWHVPPDSRPGTAGPHDPGPHQPAQHEPARHEPVQHDPVQHDLFTHAT